MHAHPLQAPRAMAEQVEFHTGLEDVQAYACRLLRKAWRSGAQVAVFGPDDLLAALDAALWLDTGSAFLPHVRLRQAPASGAWPSTVRRAPLHLVGEGVVPPHRDVAVNLGDEALERLDGFSRVIELVGTAEAAVLSGRRRWKAHVARGLKVVHHPVTAEPTASS